MFGCCSRRPTRTRKSSIVTDKLLTGYDAPLLYCLYLDKPMRDHVLLAGNGAREPAVCR